MRSLSEKQPAQAPSPACCNAAHSQVLNSRGDVVGPAAGKEMTSRDIKEKNLSRCQWFPQGADLLTSTGTVPPESFTLQARDEVFIGISGIGTLRNPAVVV